MKKRIKIFSDFDGTITVNDVGHDMFKKFADDKWLESEELWYSGRISTYRNLINLYSYLKVYPNDLYEYIDNQKIDRFFPEFYKIILSKDIPFYILSDGADLYIKRLLKKYNINIPENNIYTNIMKFKGNNLWDIEFPYYNEKICQNCASCKGYHIKQLTCKDDYIVFIGDGYSDRCAIGNADKYYAKKNFERFLQETNIDYIHFDTFNDIINSDLFDNS